MLRNIFKNVIFYSFYTLCVNLQQNNINLFYEFKDVCVLVDYKSVKLVILILLTLFERCFYLYKLITFPY